MFKDTFANDEISTAGGAEYKCKHRIALVCRYGLTTEHSEKVQQQMESIAEKLHLRLRQPEDTAQLSGEAPQRQPSAEAQSSGEVPAAAQDAAADAAAAVQQPTGEHEGGAEWDAPFTVDPYLLGETALPRPTLWQHVIAVP